MPARINGDERPSQVSPRTVWTIGLNVIAMVALLGLLWTVREVLALLVVALFLTAALNPVVTWLERRLRRWIAVLLLFFAGSVLFAGVLLTIVPMVVQQGQALVENAPEIVTRLRETTLVRWADDRFDLIAEARSALEQRAPTIAGSVMTLLGGAVRTLFDLATALIVTMFALIFGRDIYEWAIHQTRWEQRGRLRELAGRMQHAVGGYVLGTLIVASIGAVVVTLTLLILGVPYFLPLGLAMLFFGIIPYVGPIAGAVVTVATTLATAGTTSALVMLGVFLLYQVAENNLLQPLIQRRTIQINPLITVVAMLLGASVAGIVGTILALPVAAVVQVLVQDVLQRRNGNDNLVQPP
jgi:predicted PurR-regulated permease PerM